MKYMTNIKILRIFLDIGDGYIKLILPFIMFLSIFELFHNK